MDSTTLACYEAAVSEGSFGQKPAARQLKMIQLQFADEETAREGWWAHQDLNLEPAELAIPLTKC
jgi:hypothetical protein